MISLVMWRRIRLIKAYITSPVRIDVEGERSQASWVQRHSDEGPETGKG